MKSVVRRLRRLEEGLLPPVEAEALRRVSELVLDIRRRRAERLGLPVPDDVPEPVYRRGMSLGDAIRAGRRRIPERRAAEEAGKSAPREADACHT